MPLNINTFLAQHLLTSDSLLDNEADDRTYRVQQVIRHPSYNTKTLDYDVAILKLRGNTRGYPHIR